MILYDYFESFCFLLASFLHLLQSHSPLCSFISKENLLNINPKILQNSNELFGMIGNGLLFVHNAVQSYESEGYKRQNEAHSHVGLSKPAHDNREDSATDNAHHKQRRRFLCLRAHTFYTKGEDSWEHRCHEEIAQKKSSKRGCS